ncbi:MAG: hypothetical protein KY456_16440 [Chloroflexi bacterium]|nr:hypothetical protein [Chloroflexota bacterium]
MTATGPVADLELDRDLPFQHREWTVQRVGWLVMTAIIVAALIGLFGAGPISSATAGTGPLQLQFSRFERRHAPTELEVTLLNSAVIQDQVELWISSDYLERTTIESIVPEPEEVSETDNQVVYRFGIDDQARTPTIHIALEYDDPGLTTGRIGLTDGPELTFWQFVYP